MCVELEEAKEDAKMVIPLLDEDAAFVAMQSLRAVRNTIRLLGGSPSVESEEEAYDQGWGWR